MRRHLTIATLAALLAAALGGCVADQYGDESNLAAMRPGFENLNGCQPGTHGVPMYRGNGFRCVVNGY